MYQLFEFLESRTSCPILTGYFAKLVQVLITKNPNAMLGYIFNKGLDIVLCQKINSRSISEIIIKILTIENQEPDQGFYFEERKKVLIQVINQLNSNDSIAHYFAAQIVNDLIAKNLDTNCWKELVSTLLERDQISLIANAAISGIKDIEDVEITAEDSSRICASMNIFKVLLSNNVRNELIKTPKSQIEEEENKAIEEEENFECIEIIIQKFEPLVKILQGPSKTIIGPSNIQFKKLGEYRLRIVEFFLVSIKSDLKAISKALVKYNVLPVIVELFFTFENNSLLHSTVEQIISSSLNSTYNNEEIIKSLLIEGKLHEKLSQVHKNMGYSGNAIKIASELLANSEKNECAKGILNACQE